MTDVRIKDGDAVVDSTGNYEMISDTDALFQRAQICIGAKLGGFIYDRETGSDIRSIDAESDLAKERAELIINEALAHFEDTRAVVLEYGEVIKLTITIGGESRNTEVHLYGNI